MPPMKAGTASPGKDAASAGAKGRPRKVGMACIYCRRSHMTCDAGRPCKRCVKRDIGHLCHDEAPASSSKSAPGASARRGSMNSVASSSLSASPALAKVRAQHNTQPLAPSAIVDVLGGMPSAAEQQQQHMLLQHQQQQQQQQQQQNLSAPPFRLPTQSDMLSSMLSAPSPSWAASMLGGASFLGLGGGEAGGSGSDLAVSGDAAGGNEYNLLSEFLESLDGTSAVQTPAAAGGGVVASVDVHVSNGSAQAAALPSDPSAGAAVPSTALSNAAGPHTMSASNSTNTALYNGASKAGSAAGGDAGAGLQAIQALARSRDRRTSITDATLGLAGGSKTETFFLTAADQKDGTRDERLGKVIQAKLDAGLLRPYNHVKGYARLNQWMEQNCSQASRRRILKPLSIFRPAFRAVAARLTNVDLIFIEEAFERLLLDYDRVFSTQGIPACLWRRTGEIYKGNKEFADLVGVDFDALREGRCTIYELMQEESAVNYWEKYGAVCFDPGQKAVLTSCVLKTNNHKKRGAGAAGTPRSGFATPATGKGGSGAVTPAAIEASVKKATAAPPSTGKKGAIDTGKTDATSATATVTAGQDDGYRPCCFSFTIRRDAWGIPYAIVGNFLPLGQ